jgi:micrococcal nuclease
MGLESIFHIPPRMRDILLCILLINGLGPAGSLTLPGNPMDTAATIVAKAARAKPLSTVAASFGCGVALGTVAAPLAARTVVRYNTCEDLPPALFRKRATLTGRVVKVADGDTFRALHLPPLSALRLGLLPGAGAKIPKARGGRAKLSDSTLIIRIAAVDCPESAHFGSPGQPFADVATKFTESELAGKRVRLQLLSRDQYGRAVAMVTYRRGLRRRNISVELLRRGLAVVYRQGGAQYGSDGRGVARWNRIEKQAKRRSAGLWAAKGAAVDPAAYKKREREKKSKGR